MIPNHRGEIPVAILLLPFVLGMVVGLNAFSGVDLNLLFSSFALCTLLFILLNLKYSRLKIYKHRWIGGGLIAIILFLFGWILPARYNELRATDHFSKSPAQHLIVKINNEPILKNGLFRFTAAVEAAVSNGKRTAASGTLLVTIKDSAASKLNYGDELLIPGKYNTIDPPFNPAEFNYKGYLAHKNIFYQAFLFPQQYTIVNKDAGNPLIAHAIKLRRRLVAKLGQNIRDTDARAVAAALVLGYKADLSSDILEAYSKTGTVYVLTVSGAQVAIIYLVLTYGLSFLDRFKYGKVIKIVIIIALVWYYAMLTGFSVAVCRATLMLSLVLTGKTSFRYVNTLNILAASAFVLLCFDPYYITEAGFQLSYLAVFGVVILRPVVYKWFKFKNKIAGRMWAFCSFSIAIQLAISPLCMLYFHQFPVYFLVSNLFVFLPSAIIMYSGIFFLLLPKIPLLSPALAFVVEKTTVLMNKILVIGEHLPGATIDKIWLTTAEYLLLNAIVISLFYFWYGSNVKWLKVSLVCCLLLCVSFSIKSIRQSGTKNIAWLNLKKHQGIVFKNGNSAVVLTDLKPIDRNYSYSIQPYLDSCRIKSVKNYSLNADINTLWLKKKLGLIQFINTRVFICNKNMDAHTFSQRVPASFVYISDNPDVSPGDLQTNIDYQSIVIDGSNSDQTISRLEKQSAGKAIDLKILKRNKYFLSISN